MIRAIIYKQRPSIRTNSKHNKFPQQCTYFYTLGKLIQYLYKFCFDQCPSTRIKEIANNQFTTWTGLTPKNVHKYLLSSVATAKGHTYIEYARTYIEPNFLKIFQKQPMTSHYYKKTSHIYSLGLSLDWTICQAKYIWI